MSSAKERATKENKLRREAVKAIQEPLRQFARNGRWGTCESCPRNNEGIFPEFCPETTGSDHRLNIEGLVGIFNNRLAELRAEIIDSAAPQSTSA